jgi:hypothetical protein
VTSDPEAEPLWPFDHLVGHYQVAYVAATEASKDQRDRIDEIRGRAVTLLSVAAAVTAFLGTRIFDPNAFDRLETGWWVLNSRLALILALAAFLAIASAAVWAWWPLKGTFTLSGALIIETHIEGQSPPISHGELLRELALSTTLNVDANRETLLERQRALGGAMIALGFELVMLVLVLWDLVK